MGYKGIFVVFESAPKGGKTTLTNILVERLKARSSQGSVAWGRSALTVSPFAAEVRKRDIVDMGYSTAFYWADLIFHTQDVIVPNLQLGNIVIYDRYDISILAYRETYGFSHGEILLNEFLERRLLATPDLTVFLDPPQEVMIDRIRESTEESPVDRAFLNDQPKLSKMQDRTRHHLARLHRRTFTLNTASLNINRCIDLLLQEIDTLINNK